MYLSIFLFFKENEDTFLFPNVVIQKKQNRSEKNVALLCLASTLSHDKMAASWFLPPSPRFINLVLVSCLRPTLSLSLSLYLYMSSRGETTEKNFWVSLAKKLLIWSAMEAFGSLSSRFPSVYPVMPSPFSSPNCRRQVCEWNATAN